MLGSSLPPLRPARSRLSKIIASIVFFLSGIAPWRRLNWRQQSQLNFPTKRLREAYAYDYNLFEAYAAYTTGTLYQEVSDLSDANLEALISIESHRLEKGLSHHQRRANFGTDAADRLHAALAAAKARDLDSEITGYAQSVLQSYWGEIDQDDGEHVGWKRISREQVLNSASIRAPEFFESRHSIRCFDPQRKVDRSLILKAIRQARFTPSVCNRQTWRVVLCETEEAKAKALPLQNGNLGFGHLASHVLIIASDRNCFASIGERNQPWIEAGMFAMSLVYALHAQGLGTCCLNWSAEPEKDRALKIELALPESLAIGMMIAVGALRGEILVAESRRLSLELMTITR